jgi:hypothetical protein
MLFQSKSPKQMQQSGLKKKKAIIFPIFFLLMNFLIISIKLCNVSKTRREHTLLNLQHAQKNPTPTRANTSLYANFTSCLQVMYVCLPVEDRCQRMIEPGSSDKVDEIQMQNFLHVNAARRREVPKDAEALHCRLHSPSLSHHIRHITICACAFAE